MAPAPYIPTFFSIIVLPTFLNYGIYLYIISVFFLTVLEALAFGQIWSVSSSRVRAVTAERTPASPQAETEAFHRERVPMAVPSDREIVEGAPELSPAPDSQSSLRRRLHSAGAGVVAPDSSSKTRFSSADNLTADSGEDAGVGTRSNADTRDRVVEGVDREEEEKKVGSVLNGGQHEDGVGRGEGQGTGVVVPAKFLYRASAPAHRKVKESPLSSDAIFRQACVLLPDRGS